jgi:hypothetical protein
MELGYFALAERSLKLGLQYSEASDLVMQDNIMQYLMVRAYAPPQFLLILAPHLSFRSLLFALALHIEMDISCS